MALYPAKPDCSSVRATLLLPLEAAKLGHVRSCRAQDGELLHSYGQPTTSAKKRRPCRVPRRQHACCALEPSSGLQFNDPVHPARRHRHRTQALGEPRVLDSRDGTVFTHEVSLQISAPLAHLWATWFDLDSIPNWMQWIDKVEALSEHVLSPSQSPSPTSRTASPASEPPAVPTSRADVSGALSDNVSEGARSSGGDGGGAPPFPRFPEVTRWVCSSKGFEVAWTARITHVEVEHEDEANAGGGHNVGDGGRGVGGGVGGGAGSALNFGGGVRGGGGVRDFQRDAGGNAAGGGVGGGGITAGRPSSSSSSSSLGAAAATSVAPASSSPSATPPINPGQVPPALPTHGGRIRRAYVKWVTEEGLSNSGVIVFERMAAPGGGKGVPDGSRGGVNGGGEERTNVRLSISHLLPRRLASAVGAGSLRSLVQATLTSDLKRFEKYALSKLSQDERAVEADARPQP